MNKNMCKKPRRFAPSFLIFIILFLGIFLMGNVTRAQQPGEPDQPIWCHDFNTNLKYGDAGTEVEALQIALVAEGVYAMNNAPPHFDESVASAVVEFQEKYASEILTPSGLKHGTGYVGPATRRKLNTLYGCGITCQMLWWYDNTHQYCQEKTFCGEYMYLGLHTFSTEEECKAALSGRSITVLSPNGGEKWEIGKTYNITWTAPGNGFDSNTAVEIFLQDVRYGSDLSSGYAYITTTKNVGSYSWKIPLSLNFVLHSKETNLPIDNENPVYKIIISVGGSGGGGYHDESDAPFSIVNLASCPPECRAIGTKSEGWYDTCTGGLIKYQKCSGCAVVCKYQGNSAKEGWYSSCKNQLIKKTKCSTASICTDSDGGKNYYDKGTVTENGKSHTDYCQGAFYLKEYFCLPLSSTGLGGVAEENVVCPNGGSCKDGVCIKEKTVLNVSLSPDTPPAKNIPVGSTMVEVARFKLAANQATDIKINEIVIGSDIGPCAFGNVRLYEGSTQISSAHPDLVSQGESGCAAAFRVDFLVPGWSIKILSVKLDVLPETLAPIPIGHRFAFGILAASVSGDVKVGGIPVFGNKMTIASPSSIQVLSPNGGEKWETGRVYDIKWISSGINYVNLYLVNGDLQPQQGLECPAGPNCCQPSNSSIIAQGIPAKSGFYSWRIPASQPETQNARITVQSTDWSSSGYGYMDCSVDSSDASFQIIHSINNPPEIIVIPEVPSSLQPGQSVSFTWEAKDIDEDDLTWGVDWGDSTGVQEAACLMTNTASLTNTASKKNWKYTASHSWSSAGTYTVKATVSDCRGGQATSQLNIVVGENVLLDLIVSSIEPRESNFRVEVCNYGSRDLNETPVMQITANSVSSTENCALSYPLKPQECFGNYFPYEKFGMEIGKEYEVTAVIDSKAVIAESNEQNNTLTKTIKAGGTPLITVGSPNGGEQWKSGETRYIYWRSMDIEKVNIYIIEQDSTVVCSPCMTDQCCAPCNGAIVAQGIPASSYFYKFEVPQIGRPSKNVKIVVQQSVASGNCVSDWSDSWFTIVNPAVAPCTDSDGGLNYYRFGKVTEGDLVYVDYCAAETFQYDPAQENKNTLVEYYCGLPCLEHSASCNYQNSVKTVQKIFYICPNGCANGVCLPAPSGKITVTAPNGGEMWVRGSSYKITWKASGVDKVNIYLKDDNRQCQPCPPDTECPNCAAAKIASNISASQGSYTWKIPATQTVSSKYKISVIEAKYPISFSDESDSYFSIVDKSSCKPECRSIGSSVEGWYDACTGGLIRKEKCQNCEIICKNAGTRSEGWYNSCNNRLIKYANCAASVTPLSGTSISNTPSEGGGTSVLDDISNQLASMSNAISDLMDKLRDLFGR